MVLADLGRKLNAALSQLNAAPVIDDKVGDYDNYHISPVDRFHSFSRSCSRRYVPLC